MQLSSAHDMYYHEKKIEQQNDYNSHTTEKNKTWTSDYEDQGSVEERKPAHFNPRTTMGSNGPQLKFWSDVT